jgi:hypothetical protein
VILHRTQENTLTTHKFEFQIPHQKKAMLRYPYAYTWPSNGSSKTSNYNYTSIGHPEDAEFKVRPARPQTDSERRHAKIDHCGRRMINCPCGTQHRRTLYCTPRLDRTSDHGMCRFSKPGDHKASSTSFLAGSWQFSSPTRQLECVPI